MKLIRKPSAINRQIAGLIIDVIILILLLCCIFNSCFLGDFFISQKTTAIEEVYNELNKYAQDSQLYNTEYSSDFNEISDNNDVAILVMDEYSVVKRCSLSDATGMKEQLAYCINEAGQKDTVKNVSDKYKIIKLYYPKNDEDYLILYGKLSDGNYIMIRVCIEGLKNASGIANKFMINTALFGVLIATALTYIIVVFITKPIFEMIEVTEGISKMDFTKKYKVKAYHNEIDELGEHINAMSAVLEETIAQLKEANEEMRHDIEIREETENMRKEFIANVSHELKTPIALIQGYAEGLQEGIMDDENSRKIYLDVIIDESNKMNRLVREMLVLNQLEAGQMEADWDSFNVTDIVHGVLESNRLYLEAQNIVFSFVNEMDVMVKADEFLVEQVVTNFISNAIHYVMNENEITVKYELKKKKLRISVYNSGNRIPKKDISFIWDKFYKVDKARSREYGGSGIGLSVVKAVMELLGENYGVVNRQRGVEFWFELALSEDT